jgi:hypothetical protein
MAVTGLRRDAKTQFRSVAERDELVKLARYLDVERVDKLTLTGFISPTEGNGWRIHGRLMASFAQSCVISLAPLSIKHNTEIERFYLPEDHLITEQEVHVSHDEQDMPDPFTDYLDPAQLAVDELVQMIAPYPRAKGVELAQSGFAPPGITPLTDDAARPFAGLSALKPVSGDRKTK